MTDAAHDAERPSLSPTAWALLGMLSGGDELSGYDIKKWMNWVLRFFYPNPAYSQIYSELKRLEQLGLVTSRLEGGARSRRMYKITDAGMTAVTRWTNEEPVEPPTLKHNTLLRLIFGHLTNPGRLKELLAEHVEYADRMQREAATDERGAAAHPAWSYARLALQWSQRYYAAERELAQQLIKDLDAAEEAFAKAGMQWPVREFWYEVEQRITAEEEEG
ncbi:MULTISPECIES: PadR family transcriptional regulator [Mycolicibacterium]|uniref:PadR family transcriptional regulator n=1 Tax=Mycolicibacterium wolinskyi TaxID=59750 RepID=A0A1X2FBW6_9MYCO|nr:MULTISPECIES: PadR family transcriptional regulator [Mycolicibacterium]ORX15479.1 PadR family transcriptional regulator [Mycolicibacterium wolinskyi]